MNNMQNKMKTQNDIASAVSGKQKKEWVTPEVTLLSVKETKGGCIKVNCEGPWNVFFHS